MKKRTVITTEKREVWVISQGDVSIELKDQLPPDDPDDESESVTVTDHDDSDKRLTEEREEGNE